MKKFTIFLMLVFLVSMTISAQKINQENEKEAPSPAVSLENLIKQKSPTYVITKEHVSKISGIHHVYLRQAINGLEVQGTESSVHIDKTGKAITTHNNFLKDVQSTVKSASQNLSAEQAIAAVASQMGYKLSNLQQLKSEGGINKKGLFNKAGISSEDIPVKLMYYYRQGIGTVLVWELSIAELASSDWWNFRVDAATGMIIDKDNWTQECFNLNDHDHDSDVIATKNIYPKLEAPSNNAASDNSLFLNAANGIGTYNVYPMPIESPHFGVRSTVVGPENLAASPYRWHDTDGAVGAEFTNTRGNNVSAWDDEDANDAPDGAYTANSGDLVFDFPLNTTYSAGTQSTNAAVTNLFYWNNIIHDVLYQYGFDEASGNFQENNYGKGGSGSDSVNAEAQSGLGTCNANFSTPGDGSNPRMRMYVCGARDGDIDNWVIVHEYGHGISNRLSTLSGDEQMGEGWSDYYGLMLTMQSTDVGATGRGFATWLLGHGANGPGWRTQRYSTNFAVNSYTYDDIKTEAIPWGVGSVWAQMLWEMTWDLIDIYGFDTDFYNGTGGNNISLALVTEALKLQAPNPGFVDGRDAIIAADQALYGGANFCTIWNAFARRGLGFSADQGSSASKTDGTEAFDLPPTIPVITCPADIIVECGSFTAPGTTGTATATDCDPAPAFTYSDTSVAGCGNTEVITRTWTVTNSSGNSDSCDQTITVTDTTKPSITCPANVIVECGDDTSPSSTGNATGTDGCGTVSISFSDNFASGCGNSGTISRTWTATDECGNTSECVQTINVVDTTPPSIVCPLDVTVESDLGSCTATGVSLGTPTVSDNCGTVSYSNNAPGAFPFGDTAVLWTATDECGNTASCTQIVTVNKINTITTVTVDPTSQQYSDLVDFEAIIQPGNCPGAGLAATKVSFYVGTQKVGTTDLVVVGDNQVGTLTAALLEIPSQPSNGQMAPGVHIVTAEFEGVNTANYNVSDPTTNLTITQEDAIVDYTGHTLQATPGANASQATVLLSANIQDITVTDFANDPDPGDIRNATVTFVDRDNSSAVIAGPIAVTDLFDPSDPTTGSVSFDWPVDIGGASSQTFTVGIVVGGYYIRNSSEDNTIITVYRPKGDFITGGGYIFPENSVGTYASTDGMKTNFGYNVKYNKKGNKVRGHVNIIFRRLESDGVHTYQLKSNAKPVLGVDIADPDALFAEFTAKANLRDITDPLNPLSLGGNSTLKVEMTDRGEPGIDDSISFNLIDVDGILLYSSNWNGISTDEMVLSGGNLVVHSGFSTAPAANVLVGPTVPVFIISSEKNPFDGKASLILTTNDTANMVTYSVYDSNNKFLYANTLAPDQKFEFGQSIKSGMYLVIVRQGDKIGQIRMIKK